MSKALAFKKLGAMNSLQDGEQRFPPGCSSNNVPADYQTVDCSSAEQKETGEMDVCETTSTKPCGTESGSSGFRNPSTVHFRHRKKHGEGAAHDGGRIVRVLPPTLPLNGPNSESSRDNAPVEPVLALSVPAVGIPRSSPGTDTTDFVQSRLLWLLGTPRNELAVPSEFTSVFSEARECNIGKILEAMFHSLQANNLAYIVASMYIYKAVTECADLPLNAHTVRRLFCAGLMLADNVWYDSQSSPAWYARLFGYDEDTLLELMFSLLQILELQLLLTRNSVRQFCVGVLGLADGGCEMQMLLEHGHF